MVIVIIYVDDALFCGPNKAIVDKVKAYFMQKWECRDLDEAHKLLCIYIYQNGHKISINQCTYLNTVLECCKMANAKFASTPLSVRYYPMPNMKPLNTVL